MKRLAVLSAIVAILSGCGGVQADPDQSFNDMVDEINSQHPAPYDGSQNPPASD